MLTVVGFGVTLLVAHSAVTKALFVWLPVLQPSRIDVFFASAK